MATDRNDATQKTRKTFARDKRAIERFAVFERFVNDCDQIGTLHNVCLRRINCVQQLKCTFGVT